MSKYIHEKIREKFTNSTYYNGFALRQEMSLPLHLRDVYTSSNIFNQDLSDAIDLGEIRQSIINEQLGSIDKNEVKSFKPDSNDFLLKTKWYPGDTEDTFQKNLSDPVMKSLMQKIGWCDTEGNPTEIEYNLNKYGWRCKNFEEVTNESIVFLGCSNTFGVGLDEPDTFASIVSKKFNRECINLGCPGKGLDILSLYVSLFFEQEFDVSKISAVVIFLPPAGRVLSFNKQYKNLVINQVQNDPLVPQGFYNDITKIQPIEDLNDEMMGKTHEIDVKETDTISDLKSKGGEQYLNELYKFRSAIWENYMFTPENSFYKDVLNVNCIKLFCTENNIPLVVMNHLHFNPDSMDFARDMAHFGKNTNKQIANSLISKLQIIF